MQHSPGKPCFLVQYASSMPKTEANIVLPPLCILPCQMALTLLCCILADKAKREHRGEKVFAMELNSIDSPCTVESEALNMIISRVFQLPLFMRLAGLYDIDIEVRPHNTPCRLSLPGQRDGTQSQMPRSMMLEGEGNKKKRDECAYCRPCLCGPLAGL